MDIEEIWRPAPGLHRYEVSNLGSVRNVLTKKKRTLFLTKDGYYRIPLVRSHRNDKPNIPIHRLVAEAFIHNHEMKPHVNHKNGVRTDNRVDNLEWCTCSENVVHGFASNGRVSNRRGETNHSKFRGIPVLRTCEHTGATKLYRSDREAAEDGFSWRQIRVCGAGRIRTHKGFKWEYQFSEEE